jgi:hypothetical protein
MYRIGDEIYPKEHLIELKGNPHHVGRITISKMKTEFAADIDIILKESHKIFHHVDALFHYDEEVEVLNSAIQRLSEFVQKK